MPLEKWRFPLVRALLIAACAIGIYLHWSIRPIGIFIVAVAISFIADRMRLSKERHRWEEGQRVLGLAWMLGLLGVLVFLSEVGFWLLGQT